MNTVGIVSKSLTIFLIITCVTLFTPAFAASPSLSSSPSTFAQGGSPTLTITADPLGGAPAGSAPHFVNDIRVYGPISVAVAIPAGCSIDSSPLGVLPGTFGGSVWELQSGGVKVTIGIPAGTSISIPFPGGPFALVTPPGGSLTPGGPYSWVNVAGPAGGPSTTTLGTYFFAVCGRDNSILVAGGGPMQSSTFFTVSPPVAGEIIPIDTTALLIAGINQNATWVLTSLVVIGAASFGLLRFMVLRRN